MKYFTPELYVRYNSPDEAVVAEAEEEWDRAGERYTGHLEAIRPDLPATVLAFCDEHCLHDADVFAPALLPRATAQGSPQEVCIVTQNVSTLVPEYLNTLILLHYTVTEEPTIDVPLESDVFGQVQPHWLYDEFDLVAPGVFSHEILISTGRVIKLRFRGFRYEVAKMLGSLQDKGLKGFSLNQAAST
jgi:hypothetical protein